MQLLETFRKNPFAKLLLFYIIGLWLASLISYNDDAIIIPLLILLIFISCFLVTVFRYPDYHTDWLSGAIAGVILICIGFINMNMHQKSGQIEENATDEPTSMLLRIEEPVEFTKNSVRSTANVNYYVSDYQVSKYKHHVLVYFEKDSLVPNLVPGDYIVAKGRLNTISDAGNPDEFSYSQYLAIRKIYKQIYLPSGCWKLVEHSNKRSLKNYSFELRNELLQQYKKIGLSKTLYSLLSALTLGYKTDLELHTKQIFSKAGVMHVMALSGFNVAVIAGIISYLFFFSDRVPFGRIFKTIIIILVIWMFVFVTGLSPSVTRAAVMITLVLIGKLIQRRINTTNILFVSAFILLTFSPALISDISFQLSFAAVFGIIAFHPLIYPLLNFKNYIINKVWQLFTVSCAAQLSTLPLTLYYFHQFPAYFWITNLYVVPLVSLIICVAGIFLMLSFVQPLMIFFGKLLSILLTILYESVTFVEVFPFAVIEDIYINSTQTFLLIALILMIGLFIWQRNPIFLLLTFSLILVLQCTNTIHQVFLNKQRLFIVGNTRKISTMQFISGRNCILLSDRLLSPQESYLKYAFGNFWIKHGVSQNIESLTYDGMNNNNSLLGGNSLVNFCGKNILIVKENCFSNCGAKIPVKIDMLVISSNIKPDIHLINELFNPSMIIIDSSVTYYCMNEWIKTCENIGLDCWSVSKQGAYIRQL